MIRKKYYKGRSFKIKEIFTLFDKEKKTYPKHYFDSSLPEKGNTKSKQSVTFTLFRKIIWKFLFIYFQDFYFSNKKQMYFMLGGMMKKVCNPSSLFKSVEMEFVMKDRVGWLWFSRSCKFLFSFVKVKKLRGSTNIIPKLEEEYYQNNDVLLLPEAVSEIRRLEKKEMLYKI